MADETQPPAPLRKETWMDEIIEVYKKDVDRTLIRENLKLTVGQRILNLQNAQRSIEVLQRAMRAARKPE
ncbi:MAG TPA: hypothetical protein VG269_15990 [Tepidisphaeraceae bacterium]|jgi:hypothetical protein|nr:hypothetical protein [Tepidisphaeraceae bacterium]